MEGKDDVEQSYDGGRHFGQLYEDRFHAGSVLSEQLLAYKVHRPLVLGIPRGGVEVAQPIATRLGAELDVIVGRKLGSPRQQELAIGAVCSDGSRVLNRRLLELLDVPDSYLERVTAEQREEALRRETKFRAGLPALDPGGRVVILVDDGLATGATMQVCVRALRRAQVSRLVVAVPVGAQEACRELAAQVDELVCPWRPEPFFAVGAYYHKFDQVEDVEVERLLSASRASLRAEASLR